MMYPVPYADVREAVHLACEAERLGFDSMWGNDHVSTQRYVRTEYAEPPRFCEPLAYLAPAGAQRRCVGAEGSESALVERRASVAFSIASRVSTSQDVRALQESGGTADVVSEDAEILDVQRRIAAVEGWYLEPSAAICVPAVERLPAGG